MSQNARKQFQQSFNIVDMSNIHEKHVHSVKILRNLIWDNIFSPKTAPDRRFWNYYLTILLIGLIELRNYPLSKNLENVVFVIVYKLIL